MKKVKNTHNGKEGGTLVGKAHYDKDGNSLGGIKTIITDDNRPVEVEGGEVIINKHASKKHWRELSRINQSAGNGVPITEPHFKKGGNTEKSKFKSKVEERKQKVAKVMHEFKEGKLKSHGKKITKHKQAVAIALSEALKLKDGGEISKEIKAKTYKEWVALMRRDNNAHNENAHQDDVIPFWEWVSETGAMYGFKPAKDSSGDTIVVRTQDNPPNKKDVLEYVERMKNIYADENGDIDENDEESIAEDVAKEFNIDMISAYDYIDNSKLKNGGELAKGIKSEQEHIGTATKLYKRKITPEQAPKSIAKEHLKEDPKYYTKLAKAKLKDGGAIDGERLFLKMKNTDPKNFTPEMWELAKKIISKR